MCDADMPITVQALERRCFLFLTPETVPTPLHLTHVHTCMYTCSAISSFHIQGCGTLTPSPWILLLKHPSTLYQPSGCRDETSYLMEDKKSKHMEGACPEHKRLFIIIWELKSQIKNKRRQDVAFAALQPQRSFIVIQSLRILCWLARARLCRRDKIPHC